MQRAEAQPTSEIDAEHLYRAAQQVPSEHRSPRPLWALPELIVVHCISLPEGEYGTGAPQALFQGQLDPTTHPSFADLAGVRVSAHLLIDRAGRVQQFVPFHEQAWHAGVSQWCGRAGCNRFSIGIELEGQVADTYSDAQYASLTEVVCALLCRYPSIGRNAVVGHADVAPGRKQDPGPHFDWERLFRQLHNGLKTDK